MAVQNMQGGRKCAGKEIVASELARKTLYIGQRLSEFVAVVCKGGDVRGRVGPDLLAEVDVPQIAVLVGPPVRQEKGSRAVFEKAQERAFLRV